MKTFFVTYLWNCFFFILPLSTVVQRVYVVQVVPLYLCPSSAQRLQGDVKISTQNIQPYKISFSSTADHPRLRAFSYAWSLRVTWQRWRSHQSIRHVRIPHAARKLHGSRFYRIEVTTDRSFILREWHSWCLCSCDPDPVPLYTNLARISYRYTGCAKMNFLHHSFKSYRLTNRHTHTHTHDRNYTPRRSAPSAGGQ